MGESYVIPDFLYAFSGLEKIIPDDSINYLHDRERNK